jgi:hypothetical protein
MTHRRVTLHLPLPAAASPPARPLPPLPVMAGNLFASAMKVAGGALRRHPLLVDADEAERRHEHCTTCEWWVRETDRCAHPQCGCRLRYKTRLYALACPVGKWGEEEKQKAESRKLK